MTYRLYFTERAHTTEHTRRTNIQRGRRYNIINMLQAAAAPLQIPRARLMLNGSSETTIFQQHISSCANDLYVMSDKKRHYFLCMSLITNIQLKYILHALCIIFFRLKPFANNKQIRAYDPNTFESLIFVNQRIQNDNEIELENKIALGLILISAGAKRKFW